METRNLQARRGDQSGPQPSSQRSNPSVKIIGLALGLVLVFAGSVVAQDLGIDGLLADARVSDQAELISLHKGGAERLPVIVTLHASESIQQFNAWRDRPLAERHRRDVAEVLDKTLDGLTSEDFELRHRLENVPIFSGLITMADLAQLLGGQEVRAIELDGITETQTSQGITLMNGDQVRSDYSGSGRSIAIVDTGINYGHPALGGGSFPNSKVIGGANFGDIAGIPPLDLNGHGTAVAGIAAGDSVGTTFSGGVAPGARLYALKIVTGSGSTALDSAIQAAWDWCVTHQDDAPAHPIMVINTSFGGGKDSSPSLSLSFILSSAAVDGAGIALFCASGNDGYCSAISSPASTPLAISVGAVYDASIGSKTPCVDASSCVASATTGCSTGFSCSDSTTAADQVTCYSNSAYFLDILAPSNNAYTPTLGTSYTSNFGGTSAASPYAAGATAVLLHAAEAAGFALTPLDVRSALVLTGDAITDPKAGLTFPRVNLGHAAESYTDTWVDFAHSGSEDGSKLAPFNTIAEGAAAVAPAGNLRIMNGTTGESPTVTDAMTLVAEGGNVTIGS